MVEHHFSKKHALKLLECTANVSVQALCIYVNASTSSFYCFILKNPNFSDKALGAEGFLRAFTRFVGLLSRMRLWRQSSRLLVVMVGIFILAIRPTLLSSLRKMGWPILRISIPLVYFMGSPRSFPRPLHFVWALCWIISSLIIIRDNPR
jgi:hypothetical protein